MISSNRFRSLLTFCLCAGLAYPALALDPSRDPTRIDRDPTRDDDTIQFTEGGPDSPSVEEALAAAAEMEPVAALCAQDKAGRYAQHFLSGGVATALLSGWAAKRLAERFHVQQEGIFARARGRISALRRTALSPVPPIEGGPAPVVEPVVDPVATEANQALRDAQNQLPASAPNRFRNRMLKIAGGLAVAKLVLYLVGPEYLGRGVDAVDRAVVSKFTKVFDRYVRNRRQQTVAEVAERLAHDSKAFVGTFLRLEPRQRRELLNASSDLRRVVVDWRRLARDFVPTPNRYGACAVFY